MSNCKAVFRGALSQVFAHYPATRIEADGGGLTLHNSPPPVSKRMALVHKPVK